MSKRTAIFSTKKIEQNWKKLRILWGMFL